MLPSLRGPSHPAGHWAEQIALVPGGSRLGGLGGSGSRSLARAGVTMKCLRCTAWVNWEGKCGTSSSGGVYYHLTMGWRVQTKTPSKEMAGGLFITVVFGEPDRYTVGWRYGRSEPYNAP